MEFKQYMHIERFGTDEVQGIELGECYVFPKLDGTNASVWLHDDNSVRAGSRKRLLSTGSDNAGFYNWILTQDNIKQFLFDYPHLRLYGEWLVPHTLKTYAENAWRRFYVFDVMDDRENRYLHYNEYKPLLDQYNIEYIPPLSIIKNATYDNLLTELNQNFFLIRDGAGIGEGIVIKNYSFLNKWSRTAWAKIVTNHFKAANRIAMGAPIKNMATMVEESIINEYCTEHLVNKVYAKIVNECEGWNSKYIPRIFGEVYHDIIVEEMWDIVKKYKNPTINFKTLWSMVIMKIKQIKPELF